jgi:hypothetical protein
MGPMRVDPPPSEPRVGHYLFAHRAVPRAFLRDPAPIMGILGSKDAMSFLGGMWDIIDREVEPQERIDRQGLAVDCYELSHDVFVAMVTMPAPQRVLESFFVALVARLEGDTFARALTLDLAGPPGSDPLVGILEWDAEGNRTLLDATSKPEASAFVDAIEALIAKPK